MVYERAWSYMKAVEDAAQRAAATAKRAKNMVENRQVYTNKIMARFCIFFQLSGAMREGRRGRTFPLSRRREYDTITLPEMDVNGQLDTHNQDESIDVRKNKMTAHL